MEIDVAISQSPVPPPILSDMAESCTLTSPVPTQSLVCLTDSAADTEFAAPLKDANDLEVLWVAHGAEKEILIRLEIQLQMQREILAQTQQQLEAKAKENKILDRNVKDLKNTVDDLRDEVTIWKETAVPFLCFMI